ncbi:Stigma-specific STIG1-like protein 4 [Linum grandiflorum]
MLSPTVVIITILLFVSAACRPSHVGGDDEFSGRPSHLNFFRSRHRRQQGWCSRDDPKACWDRERNPWGGRTCCFGRVCKDTLRDANNCGRCGNKCPFGFVCCGGNCVDVRNDATHCGSCFQECQRLCSFGMCDYAAA